MRALYMMMATTIAVLLISASAYSSAVLVDAKGEVRVKQGGDEAKAIIGAELGDGAIVTTGKDARASVLCESGSLDEVSAGQSYTVGAPSAGKSTSLGAGITIAMKEIAAAGKGPTVHGMVKKVEGPHALKIDFDKLGGQGLVALYPSGTAVRLSPSIDFKWSEPIGKDWVKPALVVMDISGRRLGSIPLSAGETNMGVCPCKFGLAKGREYKWFLAASDKSEKSRTPEFKFQTLSDNDERRLDADLAKISSLNLTEEGKALLDAQLYFSYGLYDEAAKGLAPFYAKSQSPFAKNLLHLCYMRMGRVAEAKKYE